jgi:hypothetical protein
MGKHKYILSDQELNQLKIETYCNACGLSFFKDNYTLGRLSQIFEQHLKTKKHKLNTEKYYSDLEQQNDDNNSKLNLNLNLNLNLDGTLLDDDDNLTSIFKLNELENRITKLEKMNKINLEIMKKTDNMDICKLLVKQGKLLNSDCELSIISDSIKLTCKRLMKLTCKNM